MRLIDADALMETIKKHDYPLRDYFNSTGRGMFTFGIQQAVDEQPTIDAVEVVHGTWTVDSIDEYELSYGSTGYEPVYRCSRCGHVTESYLRLDRPIMPEDADFPNYCPNCGAKMDGEEQNDD